MMLHDLLLAILWKLCSYVGIWLATLYLMFYRTVAILYDINIFSIYVL